MHIRFKTESSELINEQSVIHKIEFVQAHNKFETLSTFLPDYILFQTETDLRYAPPFVGVILDVHVLGMHKLIEKFNKSSRGGIYKLTYILNAYLSVIIEAVTYWGGDVMKIYGNRVLNLWKVSTDEALEEILHLVILCAGSITEVLTNFNTSINQKMKLKLLITCGNLNVSFLGRDSKLLLLRGEAMEELKQLAESKKGGEVFMSSKAWAHAFQPRYHSIRVDATKYQIKTERIYYQTNELRIQDYFAIKTLEARDLISKHIEYMNFLHACPHTDTFKVVAKLMNDFKQKIPPRPGIGVAMCNSRLSTMSSYVCKRIASSVNDRQPVEYLTEITTLNIQLICVKPHALQCASDSFIQHIYHEVNNAIACNSSFIYKFEVSTEIKIVILSEFRGVSQDLESQRLLQSGHQLNIRFQNIPGVDWASVGIFHGFVYCGVLGHPFRKDYAILGTVVDKGFRIIERYQGKVMCDYRIFRFSKLSSFHFYNRTEKAWHLGLEHKQRFEYNEDLDLNASNTLEIKHELFGRAKELNMVYELLQSQVPHGAGIIIESPKSYGKSFFLDYFYRKVHDQKEMVVSLVKLEDFCSVPYFAIRKTYAQLYFLLQKIYSSDLTKTSLPSELMDPFFHHHGDDYDLAKYYILTNVRDLIDFDYEQCTLVMFDNIEYIDASSWDIIKILLETSAIRLVATAIPNKNRLYRDIVKHEFLDLVKLEPLSDYWISSIACQLMNVGALSEKLSNLICETCRGVPGNVSCVLTYFVGSDTAHILYMLKNNIPSNWVTIDSRVLENMPEHIAVMMLHRHHNNELIPETVDTMDIIVNEFYLSLSQFERNIVMTSSVLGKLFTRNLLYIALRYPDMEELAEGIKHLYERDIFDCGSNFANGYAANVNQKFCCKCYFSDTELRSMRGEKYMYCKLLHFANENVREVAYDLIPLNQKKDLHLLCTDVLEYNLQICPRCVRDPSNSFLIVFKYSEVLELCDNDVFPKVLDALNDSDRVMLQNAVRRKLNMVKLDSGETKTITEDVHEEPLRNIFNRNECSCFDIFTFAYKQLIYHSSVANHLGKRIFFMTTYGTLLILAKEPAQAITVLREAHEFCLVQSDTTYGISTAFRKYHICKISRAITCAFITLRQVKEAKNQIVIALRQLDIPNLMVHYWHFRYFLKRKHLNKARWVQPTQINSWVKVETAMTMVVLARISIIEGDLNCAKYYAKYSIWLLERVNPNLPILFDVFCSVIELYRYGLDTNICEKLERYVTRSALIKYSSNQGFVAKHIMYLLTVKFYLKFTKGELNEAISLCYRIIDFSVKVYIFVTPYEVIPWITVLFIYKLKIKEYVDLLSVVDQNRHSDSKVHYYINLLNFCTLTGYTLVKMGALIKDVEKVTILKKQKQLNWEKNLLLSLLYLHLVKMKSIYGIEKYKPTCPFNNTTMKRPIAIRILLNELEASLYELCYKDRHSYSFTKLYDTINHQFSLLSAQSKFLKVFLPRIYVLKSWKAQLCGSTTIAKAYLRKAEKMSIKLDNRYFLALVQQLRYSWKNNVTRYEYKVRVRTVISDAIFYNETQWAQILIPYPLN